MYQNKCELLKISREIEIVYEKINENLTPLQTAKLLYFLEKYKFESNFYTEESVRKMYQELSSETTFCYGDQSNI
jgi:hypothetical protein